ncbi:MAG: LysM peptidoglycan-binding domain-containing protein [Verrucomicrobia bacterium]|nr:LysM peptidoglycan-binding domain-containing protein [Verrucomicrobiota bacterium]
MKLLKVFGAVVGVHVFALILIFANPGCSSTSKPAPTPADTVAKAEPAASPSITVPTAAASADSPVITGPGGFDPNAPAVASSPTIRFSPTRPNTPAAGALEAEPVADVTPATTYLVGRGDSLWTIAKKHHVAVSDLAAANNLKAGSSVRVGQKLIIPGKALPPGTAAAHVVREEAKAPAAAAPATPSADAVKHTVKAGETLGAIARKYGVRMGDLATANNIADPAKIRPGMELVVPGWQAPAGRGGRAAKAATTTAATPPEIPTIRVSTDAPDAGPAAKAGSDAPVITVEDNPSPKKP